MNAISPPNASTDRVSVLENGDRLHSMEFLRRYELMPDLKKAELVDGLVYKASPVSVEHSERDGALSSWLSHYAAFTPGFSALPNTTVILDPDNTFQPDVCLIQRGKVETIEGKSYVKGPLELVVEIALSSVSLDNHAKKRIYERSGVPEYIVWRVEDEALDWWALTNQEYVPIEPLEFGHMQSLTHPGLELNLPALLEGDNAAVLTTLQNAIAKRDE